MKELKVKSGDSLFFKLVFRTLLNIYDDVFSKIQHHRVLTVPFRSSPPQVLLGEGVLTICSKFTG